MQIGKGARRTAVSVYARTICNPVTFAMRVLSDGHQFEIFLAFGILRIYRGAGGCGFLVLVVHDAPRVINGGLDLRRMAEL